MNYNITMEYYHEKIYNTITERTEDENFTDASSHAMSITFYLARI